MLYRHEIDGLRALAVLPVILFHNGFELFRGGFVGVDIFFVISGYLITSLLIEDLEKKRFSILNFYERRARRILPALFFVMLVSIPFAWMWMSPGQMKDFSQSFVAVSLFASNILFFIKSGYFQPAAEEMPFLHTWSLAVEEQYYILFPIYLILTWRFGRNKVFWVIVMMTVISLFISEWGWRITTAGNFYLLPSRAWELLAGSITAFITQRKGVMKSNFLTLLGVAGILYSIFFFDQTIPFPSFYTLIPVLGTVLIILYANKLTLIAKLLSTKFFIGIGLISYSAYLWHYPLVAFAKIYSSTEPSQTIKTILALSSLGFGYLSWRFIEKPFRDKTKISKKKIFVLTIVGIAIFSIFGSTVYYKKGNFIFNSLPPNINFENLGGFITKNKLPCEWSSEFNDSNAYQGCIFGDKDSNDTIVLLGDSHSEALSYALEKWAFSNKKRVLWLKMNGCEYLPNVVRNRRSPNENCRQNHSELINLISSLNADVIAIFRWTFRMYPIDGLDIQMPYRNSYGDVEHESYREYFIYKDGLFSTTYEAKQQFLNDYVLSIADVARNFFLVYPVPETAINIKQKNFEYWRNNNKILKEISTNILDYYERNSFVIETFQNLKASNIVHILPSEILCDIDKCYMQRNGIPFYLDDDHLSYVGAEMVIKAIQEKLTLIQSKELKK